VETAESPGRWVKYPGPRPRAHTRLFAFHYAGGSASIFRAWPGRLPDGIEVIAIQLPGREGRIAEPPYDRMDPLVDQLIAVLQPHLDRPFVYFGCSMGARVSYALAQAQRERGLPLPGALFLAASPGPSLPVRVPGWDEPDEQLVDYLRGLGGTPGAVLDKPELLSLVLPTVRADLTVVATWPYTGPAALPIPIHAFAGADDHYATPDRMAAWRRETEQDFTLSVIDGGHFFIHSALPEVLDLIARDLEIGVLT
jgi:surfactin synthase thioesterase subunit